MRLTQRILLGHTGLCKKCSWSGNKGEPWTLAHCWGVCLLDSRTAADLGSACKELEGKSDLHETLPGSALKAWQIPSALDVWGLDLK